MSDNSLHTDGGSLSFNDGRVSYAGDPVTSYDFGSYMGSGDNTKEEVIQEWEDAGGNPGGFGWHREMITEAALTNCDGGKGRGAPVPIDICF